MPPGAISPGEITEALERRLIFRLAGPLRGRSVLDVGCGDGTLALACAALDATAVCGCDPDPRMIADARARAACDGAAVDFAVAHAEALPYADGSFDVVTCITVLTFVPRADAAIAEIARVMRPGGRLVIGDLGRWSSWAARRRIRGWFGAKLWRSARFRTAGELAGLIQTAGLTVETAAGAIFYPPSVTLARLMARFDPALGRATTVGAAFVAVQGRKQLSLEAAATSLPPGSTGTGPAPRGLR